MPAKKKSLAHGRPPTIQKPKASLSSEATRTLIRTHHTLQKQHAKAIKDGDDAKAASIRAQIDQQGGLKSYQQASITGQSAERGGDSSKVLMEWLDPEIEAFKTCSGENARLRLLEVGALSPSNACSRSPALDVTRIDLHSQHASIQTQDFMERPLPCSDEERFDIISLSLVLNYGPDATGRGEMLRRTTQFLRGQGDSKVFPCLFLVLPAPCITNSRYMDESHLTSIMNNLGYKILHRKITAKLVYYLCLHDSTARANKKSFPKKEMNPGKTRNNFCVILR